MLMQLSKKPCQRVLLRLKKKIPTIAPLAIFECLILDLLA